LLERVREVRGPELLWCLEEGEGEEEVVEVRERG